MAEQERIFWGTIVQTTDDNLLAPGDNSPFLAVDIPFVDGRFNHHRVSILGHLGAGPGGSAPATATIITKKWVLHDDIASRAYEIFRSGAAGSAFDNWLRAERELLGQ